MLRIGLTACFFHPDVERRTFGRKTLLYYEKDMSQWIMSQGHYPVLLPMASEKMSVTEVLNFVDGVILHGGADLDPRSYGEEPLEEKWSGDAIRDKYETEIYFEALKQNKPVLGICRGIQLMNMAHKGSLYQDIPTMLPKALKHRDPHIYDGLYHTVEFQPDSLLNEIYGGTGPFKTNTVHHQAIKDVGKDLIVEAHSPEDGIIEGLRHKDTKKLTPEHPYALGVQWHPEFMMKLDNSFLSCQTLLSSFIEEIKIRK